MALALLKEAGMRVVWTRGALRPHRGNSHQRYSETAASVTIVAVGYRGAAPRPGAGT